VGVTKTVTAGIDDTVIGVGIGVYAFVGIELGTTVDGIITIDVWWGTV